MKKIIITGLLMCSLTALAAEDKTCLKVTDISYSVSRNIYSIKDVNSGTTYDFQTNLNMGSLIHEYAKLSLQSGKELCIARGIIGDTYKVVNIELK